MTVIKNIWKDIDFYRTLFGMQGVNVIVLITCYDEENPGQVVSASYVFFASCPQQPILQPWFWRSRFDLGFQKILIKITSGGFKGGRGG